jgi:hypothetical protein
MDNNETNRAQLGEVIGSLLAGLLFAVALIYAFNLTWPQGLVLSWMYCLLRDSIVNGGKK